MKCFLNQGIFYDFLENVNIFNCYFVFIGNCFVFDLLSSDKFFCDYFLLNVFFCFFVFDFVFFFEIEFEIMFMLINKFYGFYLCLI